MTSLKKSIEKLKPKGTSKRDTRSAYKTVTQLVKSIPKAGKLKKRLGVNKKPANCEWWANKQRKKRKDRIKDDTKSEIREFYLSPEISREVPVKRECVTIVDTNTGLRTTVQKQVMIMTQSEAYKKYVETYGKKVGFTSFKNNKPANVRRISETNRRTCLCTICANVALKVESISKHVKSKLKSEQSENLTKLSKMSKDNIVKHTLCNEGANGKHNVECLKRTCEICGIKKIDELYKDLDLTCTVEWCQWENIMIEKETGIKHCMSCVVKKTTLGEMLDVFKTNLKTYPEHIFRAEWQHEMIKKCQDNLKPGQVMTVMDFSENYNCKFQNEVQNAFFDQNQVTVHPVMAYYKTDGDLVKHSIIVISPDTKHDSHSVNTFRKAVLHKLSETTDVQEVIEWTDGCAAQYKGRSSFADITLSTLPKPLLRNFFETSHGKSVCDGIGAIAKNYRSRAVLSGKAVLGTADQVYEYLNKNLIKTEKNSKRDFIFVKNINRNRPEVDVDTVKGTRKFHCVCQKEPYVMLSRNLSCFCNYCLSGDFLHCSNIPYVEEWQEQKIQKLSGKGGRQSHPKKGKLPKASCSTDKSAEKNGDDSQSVDVDVHVGQYVEVEIAGKKSKKIFVAQVTDKDCEEVEVSFMEKKGTMYFWPDEQEKTWEFITSIKKVLTTPEMSEKSTNDRQYFYFKQ